MTMAISEGKNVPQTLELQQNHSNTVFMSPCIGASIHLHEKENAKSEDDLLLHIPVIGFLEMDRIVVQIFLVLTLLVATWSFKAACTVI